MTLQGVADVAWENWSGSVSATPATVYYPETEADLVEIVERHAPEETIRVVGAGHSSTQLCAVDDVLVSMEALTGIESVEQDANQATVLAGTRLSAMNAALAEHGLAMANMGDIDRQRLAGAISTGTHGTGTDFGILSTQIARIRIVTADAEVIEVTPETDRDMFRAAQVSLGALGLISTITLDLQPAYSLELRKTPMALETALERADEFNRDNRHFEFFWYPDGQAKVKRINTTDRSRPPLTARVRKRIHTIGKRLVPPRVRYWARGLTDVQFGEHTVGPSHEIFPSVRDIRFNEMEYAVPAEMGPDAMYEIRDVIDAFPEQITFPVEYRYVNGDEIPLSPAYGRETVYIAVHRYHEKPYETFFDQCEAIFRRYDGRPHWGKHHSMTGSELAMRYPEWDTFQAVRESLDPDGVFLNDYLRELFGVESP